MAITLSKSKYMGAQQCPKRLWLTVHAPDKATPSTESQKRILEQGTAVGKQAQKQFPEGVLIPVDSIDLEKGFEETKKVIAQGTTTIFEATFFFNNTYILADIITKNKDGSWDLFEVKASTKAKKEHIEDLALQCYVLTNCGLNVNKVGVMHINKACDYSDLSNLFTKTDVTDKVKACLPEVASKLENCHTILLSNNEPDIEVGSHCTSPYPCPFNAYCWKAIENKNIFDIPRLSSKKKDELRKQGIIYLEQLPADYPLSDVQQAYVKRILNNEINIDGKQIRNKLAQLQYPLYFLDFETDAQAIPQFEGTHPYQQMPFQYSCHVMQADGKVAHYEYLHTDETDPRPALAKSLVELIKQDGSLIAYNAGFEKRILLDLAAIFPDYAESLKSMGSRLWDQLNIFKADYQHVGFGNSNSIKSVLPVLVPGLSYKNLAVQRGDEAQSVWNDMIKLECGDEKDALISNLLAYCELDTLAMVEIHKVLANVAKGVVQLPDFDFASITLVS